MFRVKDLEQRILLIQAVDAGTNLEQRAWESD